MKCKQFNTKGFTLIELLIVIAIIGILAVGLLVAINPIETTKKSADTANASTVKQVFDAMNRYYTSKLTMPWCPSSGACTDPSAGVDFSGSTALQNMVADNDVRASFTVPANTVFYYGNSTAGTVIVCYKPTSKSLQSDPNTKYTDTKGTVNSAQCQSSPGTCYWCLQ